MEALLISSVLVGLISALAGVVSNYKINKTNERNVQQTNQANAQLAGQQNQWNLEQWNRENTYNSPVQQLARLSSANINPHLAMSNSGMVDAGNALSGRPAASIPSVPAQAVPYQPTGELANTLSDIRLKEAQADNLDAQTHSLNEKLPEEVSEIKESVNVLVKQQAHLDAQIADLHASAKERSEHEKLMFEQRGDIIYKQALANKEYSLQVDNYNLAVKEFEQAAKESQARIKKMMSDIGVNESIKRLNQHELFEMNSTFFKRMLGMQLDYDYKARQFEMLGFDLQGMRFRANTGLQGLYNQGKAGRAVVRWLTAGSQVINSMYNSSKGILDMNPTYNKMQTFEDAVKAGANAAIKR